MDPLTLPVPDKKRRRASWFAPVVRLWQHDPDGGIVRWLMVSRYDGCMSAGDLPRDFYCRLADNDPRPRGIESMPRRMYPGAKGDAMRRHSARELRKLPFGQWIEVTFDAGEEQPAKDKPVLLLAEHSTVTGRAA
ncbi:hypothetical protein OPIT5_08230 [Opitutaceae bacterium TAV5]|nr:hypothetical protein OPIT5_08230 [Opitutaceae bacterium TAV5]